MLIALEKSLGVVTSAARSIGLERRTHYNWMNADPEYKQAVEELNDLALDYAESKLHQQIEGGEVAATIFYLKCKGKKRGYVERQEFTGADGGPLQIEQVTGMQFKPIPPNDNG